jgi:hypothetical protein
MLTRCAPFGPATLFSRRPRTDGAALAAHVLPQCVVVRRRRRRLEGRVSLCPLYPLSSGGTGSYNGIFAVVVALSKRLIEGVNRPALGIINHRRGVAGDEKVDEW